MNTHPRCSVPSTAQHQATGSAMPGRPPDAAAVPDAELIALCAEFDTLQHRITAFYAGGETSIADDDEREAVAAPLKEQQRLLADRICALRAITTAGLRARAETLALYSPEMSAGAEEAGGHCDDRMVAALLRDMTGRA